MDDKDVAVEEEQYQDEIESLINISRLTGKDNSILFDFHVKDDSCRQRVAIIEHTGSKNELIEKTFPYNSLFQEKFLKKFIQNYIKNHEIVLTDVVDDSSNLSYRMINNYNDMITVSGISASFAKELVQLTEPLMPTVAEVGYEKVKNQKGISTVATLAFISVFLGLLLIGMFFLY